MSDFNLCANPIRARVVGNRSAAQRSSRKEKRTRDLSTGHQVQGSVPAWGRPGPEARLSCGGRAPLRREGQWRGPGGGKGAPSGSRSAPKPRGREKARIAGRAFPADLAVQPDTNRQEPRRHRGDNRRIRPGQIELHAEGGSPPPCVPPTPPRWEPTRLRSSTSRSRSLQSEVERSLRGGRHPNGGPRSASLCGKPPHLLPVDLIQEPDHHFPGPDFVEGDQDPGPDEAPEEERAPEDPGVGLVIGFVPGKLEQGGAAQDG